MAGDILRILHFIQEEDVQDHLGPRSRILEIADVLLYLYLCDRAQHTNEGMALDTKTGVKSLIHLWDMKWSGEMGIRTFELYFL